VAKRPSRKRWTCSDCGHVYRREITSTAPCKCGGELCRLTRRLPGVRIHLRVPPDIAAKLGPRPAETVRALISEHVAEK
jgi:hypothetical protein